MSRRILCLFLVVLVVSTKKAKKPKKPANHEASEKMGDIPVAGGVDVQVEEVIEEVVDKEDVAANNETGVAGESMDELRYVGVGANWGDIRGGNVGGGVYGGGNVGGGGGGYGDGLQNKGKGYGGNGGRLGTQSPVSSTSAPVSQTQVKSSASTQTGSTTGQTGATGSSGAPSTATGSAVTTPPWTRGCWLQLPSNGQWVWNSKTYSDKCGGYVQLPNCEWKWTVHPEKYRHVTCYDMVLSSNSGISDEDNGDTDGVGDGGDAGGNAGGDDGDEGDEDDEDGEDGEDDEDDEDDDVGEGEDDGGDAGGYEIGDDGGGESTCVCGDWDFPGECGSDGLIFRWRSCEPRYCLVEDEYVVCP